VLAASERARRLDEAPKFWVGLAELTRASATGAKVALGSGGRTSTAANCVRASAPCASLATRLTSYAPPSA
jgi:hypothetical protein